MEAHERCLKSANKSLKQKHIGCIKVNNLSWQSGPLSNVKKSNLGTCNCRIRISLERDEWTELAKF